MSRIENLGDYNDVRILLQKFGGDKEKLFKHIGDVAVAKKSPKLLTRGGIIGGSIVLAVGGTIWAGKKGLDYIKDRKAKIKSEPELKEIFNEMVDAEQAEKEME